MLVIKKYGNRRLYDTGESRYITLEELAAKIRTGVDVQVVDAKSGLDLTQATLTQIILESRGASRLLPVPLLFQLIRMGDTALAEFFGQYMGAALEMYLQAKQSAQQLAGYNPFAALPFGAGQGLGRLFGGANPWGAPAAPQQQQQTPAPPPMQAQPPAPAPANDGVAELRRELEELKQAIKGTRKKKR